MRKPWVFVAAVVVVASVVSVVLADARQDLRIQKADDENRNIVFSLVNIGNKSVRAKIEYAKTCSGVTSRQKPRVMEYWLGPKETVKLGKAWRESSCEHRYRVVEARYY